MQKIIIKSILPLLLITNLFFHSKTEARQVQNLNNDWQFVLVDRDIEYINLNKTSWEPVILPHTWNNQDIQSGDKVHYGTGWYKRELKIKTTGSNQQYFLRFEGVGQYAEAYVNGQFIGKHLGSYSAFVFNITGFLQDNNSNTLHVKVNNELTNSYPKDNYLFGIYGGIYRDVSLITTDAVHIGLTDNASNGVYVHQDLIEKQEAKLKIVCNLKNDGNSRSWITVRHSIYDEDKNNVSESIQKVLVLPGGIKPFSAHLELEDPILWNGRKNPYRYNLETQVIREEKVVDEVIQKIGLRSYSIDPDEGFILNGEPYRLYGVCRHQEWEDIGNALLPKHHRKDMELIYEMGTTSIRLAHYQQDQYIYDLADSMGILVWAEIPFVNGYNENADPNAMQQLAELIKQNFNHPSIFVWGLHNEVIKNKPHTTPAVHLTNQLHNLAKTLDPSRHTVSVSNIWWIYDHPIHEIADLQGYNQYTGWYGGRPEELEKWIRNYHTAKPDVRFSVSEYGAGGNIAHQTNDVETVPEPKGKFFPETYQTHYHEKTWAAIEKYPFIWSSYIWNMFDFSVPEWNRGGIKGRNHKGLITYDRKTKKDAFYWYKANWSEEPVLFLPGKRNNTSDQRIHKFKAYCNVGIPDLYVNNKYKGKMKRGVNNVQYVSQDMKLKKGKNEVLVKVFQNDQTLSDKFTFYVQE